MNVVLRGVVGSHAFGLATLGSDIDRAGIFIEPTENLLGLKRPEETIVTNNPDVTMHELGKFVRLALKANPSVLELLYLPEYDKVSLIGAELVLRRDIFLSTTCVRNSYGHYAYQQARRLQETGQFESAVRNRYAKHARHCFRLLSQGKELLTTGKLTVRVSNPEELFEIGKLPPERLVPRFIEAYEAFCEATSVLPDEPDREQAERLLRRWRISLLFGREP